MQKNSLDSSDCNVHVENTYTTQKTHKLETVTCYNPAELNKLL